MPIEVLVWTSEGVTRMLIPNSKGEMPCPHCGTILGPRDGLPIEPMLDGRWLRDYFGWSKDRWTSYWSPRFPAYFQYKHGRGSVKPQLIRVFPARQVKAFVDSGVWLKPAQKKNRRTK
jgi:hypothetical protein